MLKKIRKHSHLLHKTGMTLSFLCLIHCLAMPFIITLLPLVAKGFMNHTLEIFLVAGSFVIAVLLLTKDYRIHRKTTPLLLLFGASILQYIGLFVVIQKQESMFVISGSILMAISYLSNWNLHQKMCSNHRH
ncbi:MerC domain-containing protein [Lacihabitans sp. CCS-44]|uniref:MerC domain-containing protein n=1 Tax=Lacihabitans sp. CCS-44 TaxID=2487331 RepID=UPI0020CFD81E|nr:MerC domain-containing protein [Lacihabitans sp. CCS-44]MCP9756541.1 MerC domain-containing protein [Lacihabitans sp. CCS-44]